MISLFVIVTGVKIITYCFRLKISILIRRKVKLPADHALEVYSNTTINLLPEGEGRGKRL